MFQISVSSVLSGRLGFDADGIETADVMIGDEGTDNAGIMWVVPKKDDGASKVKRLRFAIVIKANPPPGLPLQPDHRPDAGVAERVDAPSSDARVPLPREVAEQIDDVAARGVFQQQRAAGKTDAHQAHQSLFVQRVVFNDEDKRLWEHGTPRPARGRRCEL